MKTQTHFRELKQNSGVAIQNYRYPLSLGAIVETRYYIDGFEVFRRESSQDAFERTTLNISDNEKVFVRVEQKTGEREVDRYQYDNHLGSACLELDIAGQIISYEEYHPFGTTSYRSGRSETEVSLKRYKYCGKEQDEETGLYYYGMRYYAACLCRFVSVDPLQFEYPHYTPYQYAGNKPISFIDLDGGEEKNMEEEKRGRKGGKKEGKKEGKNENEPKLLSPGLYKILSEVLDGKEGAKGLIDREKEENRREYGGTILSDKEGNLRIIWAKPGDIPSSEDEKAHVNLLIAENEDEQKILNNPGAEGYEVIAYFHSHPSVRKENPIDIGKLNKIETSEFKESFVWEQHPSTDDIEGAKEINEFVFAMGGEEIFKYDKNTKDHTNPGNISFQELRNWKELYNSSRQFFLKFPQKYKK